MNRPASRLLRQPLPAFDEALHALMGRIPSVSMRPESKMFPQAAVGNLFLVTVSEFTAAPPLRRSS